MEKKTFIAKVSGNRYVLIIAPIIAGIAVWILSGIIMLSLTVIIAGLILNWKKISNK